MAPHPTASFPCIKRTVNLPSSCLNLFNDNRQVGAVRVAPMTGSTLFGVDDHWVVIIIQGNFVVEGNTDTVAHTRLANGHIISGPFFAMVFTSVFCSSTDEDSPMLCRPCLVTMDQAFDSNHYTYA
jgi:hypothetical protein